MSGSSRPLPLFRPLGLLLIAALTFCLEGARAAAPAQNSPPTAGTQPLRGGFTVTYHGNFSWGSQDITCTYHGGPFPWTWTYSHPMPGTMTVTGSSSSQYGTATYSYLDDPSVHFAEMYLDASGPAPTGPAQLAFQAPLSVQWGASKSTGTFVVGNGSPEQTNLNNNQFNFQSPQFTGTYHKAPDGTLESVDYGGQSTFGGNGDILVSVHGHFSTATDIVEEVTASPSYAHLPPGPHALSEVVTFTAVTDPASSSVKWSGDLGVHPKISGATVQTRYASTGSHSVTATCTAGGQTDSGSAAVYVGNLALQADKNPVAWTSSGADITVTLQGAASATDTVKWSGDLGSSHSSPSPSTLKVHYDQPGKHTVTAKVGEATASLDLYVVQATFDTHALQRGSYSDGSPLPLSVPPNKPISLDVEINPSLAGTPYHVTFQMAHQDSGSGTARLLGGTSGLQSSGPVQLVGEQMTEPDGGQPAVAPRSPARLTVEADVSGAKCGESPGFSVCAHPSGIQFSLIALIRNTNRWPFGGTPTGAQWGAVYGLLGNSGVESDSGRRGDLSLVRLREMLTYPVLTGYFASSTHEPSGWTSTGAAAGHSDLVGIGSPQGWDPDILHQRGLIHDLAQHPTGTQTVEQYFQFYCPRCGMSAATPGDVPNSGFEHQQQVAPAGTNVYLLTSNKRPHAQGNVGAGTVTNSRPQMIRIP